VTPAAAASKGKRGMRPANGSQAPRGGTGAGSRAGRVFTQGQSPRSAPSSERSRTRVRARAPFSPKAGIRHHEGWAWNHRANESAPKTESVHHRWRVSLRSPASGLADQRFEQADWPFFGLYEFRAPTLVGVHWRGRPSRLLPPVVDGRLRMPPELADPFGGAAGIEPILMGRTPQRGQRRWSRAGPGPKRGQVERSPPAKHRAGRCCPGGRLSRNSLGCQKAIRCPPPRTVGVCRIGAGPRADISQGGAWLPKARRGSSTRRRASRR